MTYVKVYRPPGCRFAEGEGKTCEAALEDVACKFKEEFGELPRDLHQVWEVMGFTGKFIAVLFEVIEQ